MANKTTHYELIKPLQEEFYNIDEHNANMDVIDEALNANKKQSDDHAANLENPHKVTAEQVGAQPENGNLVEYVGGVLRTVSGTEVESEDDSDDAVESVTSVNGKTGDVTLGAGDVGAVKVSGDTMTGMLKAANNTEYTTGQVRNIFLVADGDSLPTTKNGDVVLIYTP